MKNDLPIILSAKPVISATLPILKQKVLQIKNRGVTPTLKVVLVGDDPSSHVYVKNKKIMAQKIGCDCDIVYCPQNISPRDYEKIVHNLNYDSAVHGIILQSPVPNQLKHLPFDHLVNPEKDVDGFHFSNIQKLYRGYNENAFLAPCTPRGIIDLLKYYNINLAGINVLILGRSFIVGKPLSLLLTNHDCTVTLAHSKSRHLEFQLKHADMIIAACGIPELITGENLRNDRSQIVVDVGINRKPDGSLCGDCHYQEILSQVKAITPVPGGVGPMTVLSLMKNLLLTTEKQLGIIP